MAARPSRQSGAFDVRTAFGGSPGLNARPVCARLAHRTGAAMSQYYKQLLTGRGDAKRLLNERLHRKEIGDAAYEKAISHADDRAFKRFGIVFIAVLGAVFVGMAWLGY